MLSSIELFGVKVAQVLGKSLIGSAKSVRSYFSQHGKNATHLGSLGLS